MTFDYNADTVYGLYDSAKKKFSVVSFRQSLNLLEKSKQTILDTFPERIEAEQHYLKDGLVYEIKVEPANKNSSIKKPRKEGASDPASISTEWKVKEVSDRPVPLIIQIDSSNMDGNYLILQKNILHKNQTNVDVVAIDRKNGIVITGLHADSKGNLSTQGQLKAFDDISISELPIEDSWFCFLNPYKICKKQTKSEGRPITFIGSDLNTIQAQFVDILEKLSENTGDLSEEEKGRMNYVAKNCQKWVWSNISEELITILQSNPLDQLLCKSFSDRLQQIIKNNSIEDQKVEELQKEINSLSNQDELLEKEILGKHESLAGLKKQEILLQNNVEETKKTLLEQQRIIAQLGTLSDIQEKVAQLDKTLNFNKESNKNPDLLDADHLCSRIALIVEEKLQEALPELQINSIQDLDEIKSEIKQIHEELESFKKNATEPSISFRENKDANFYMEDIYVDNTIPDLEVGDEEVEDVLEDYLDEVHEKQNWNPLRKVPVKTMLSHTATIVPNISFAYQFGLIMNNAHIVRLPVACDWCNYKTALDNGLYRFFKEANSNPNENYIMFISNMNMVPVETYLLPLLECLNGDAPILANTHFKLTPNMRILASILPVQANIPSVKLSYEQIRGWGIWKDDSKLFRYPPSLQVTGPSQIRLNKWTSYSKSFNKVDIREEDLP